MFICLKFANTQKPSIFTPRTQSQLTSQQFFLLFHYYGLRILGFKHPSTDSTWTYELPSTLCHYTSIRVSLTEMPIRSHIESKYNWNFVLLAYPKTDSSKMRWEFHVPLRSINSPRKSQFHCNLHFFSICVCYILRLPLFSLIVISLPIDLRHRMTSPESSRLYQIQLKKSRKNNDGSRFYNRLREIDGMNMSTTVWRGPKLTRHCLYYQKTFSKLSCCRIWHLNER